MGFQTEGWSAEPTSSPLGGYVETRWGRQPTGSWQGLEWELLRPGSWQGTGTMEGSSCPLSREPDARVQLEESGQELVSLWGGGRPQQGQPDRVAENTRNSNDPCRPPLPVSEAVAGSASREAPGGGGEET